MYSAGHEFMKRYIQAKNISILTKLLVDKLKD